MNSSPRGQNSWRDELQLLQLPRAARANSETNVTWSRLDFHTRSYATLTTARSARIARNAEIPEAHPQPALYRLPRPIPNRSGRAIG